MRQIRLSIAGKVIARVTGAQAANAVMRLLDARVNGFWSTGPVLLVSIRVPV